MNYLSAENISKNYADRWLFKDLNFGINRGQRIGLVGVNGTGKTTLLRILAGEIQPDSGSVSTRNGILVGYLSQNPVFLNEDATVQEALFSGTNDTLNAIREYEAAMANENIDHDVLQKAMDRMTDLNAWDYEQKVKQILGKLGIPDLNRPIRVLSGGQRKRVAMARMLITEPDLLILDEPTNHLDLDTIEWLENVLSTQQQTLLMVTHDRYFLDRVATEIAELDQGQVFSYKGNYAYFLEKKAEREEMQGVEVDRARNLMRKELEWMRRQPKARGTKSKSRIDAFYETKEKAAGKSQGPSLDLSVKTTRQGNKILEVSHISKSFGNKKVIDNFSYVFKKKDRIGIIGPNGMGKSTLLNILTGLIQPDSGEIEKGETTVFGYYTQTELTFKEDQRVIDIVKEVAEVVETAKGEVISASQFLQHFQFAPAQQYTMVGKLSGGEKRRLQLLRVLIKNPNFLILDEPTNDLDIITLNILEDFLLNFGGCLLIVSHDRYFMDQLIDHAFIFEGNGRIRNFPGNYTDYREWLKEQDKTVNLQPEKPKTANPAPAAAPTGDPFEKKRKASFKEKQEYEQLEKDIEKLELRKEALVAEMNSGALDHQQLSAAAAEMEQINKDLDQKGERWLELGEIV
ncbi:ABC-F family ATP-binding cassette domain-containing protein [Adhaeribacter soli]|uniref:ABC-F family ATP-binding cassette domain-containing protein n=1 Tax=Adhaeribacter soli TaxID=2607655 RepID=A0A5N1IU35_9BACT|nr:ABC-F family ATP-binding cassette domain-containing protein [Adhaeribacter soli]KAA9332606.1 ABC-F family ATP-binding cassette domain-containing protein [Adhaeribacter soli]